jgi:excisionase family DNA binding protein
MATRANIRQKPAGRPVSAKAPGEADLPRRAYTVKETHAMLGISHAHFYRLVKLGKVRPIKLGNRTLVPVAQIDALLAGE